MSRFLRLYRPPCIVLVVALVILLGFKSLQAQSFDYKDHPKLDFDFISLNLEMGIQPQNLAIDGAATYNVKANVSGADTLRLFASHLDVSNVKVADQPVEYSLHNDSLFIPVADSAEAGSRYKVRIRYSGRPQFGLLKNSNGTVWTSLLPKTQRHWVPVVDNPQVDFKTKITFTIPAEKQLWATGQKMSEKTVAEGVKQYQFVSQKQIPASSLSFAIGDFSQESTTYGIKDINVAVEQSLTDSIETQRMLKKAHDYLGEAEENLQREYPFSRLNIVVMGDHHWETKAWGASTVFVYANRGNLDAQLLQGIIGQWFGVKQREGQWSQADASSLYQTVVANELLSDRSLKLDRKDSPDPAFSTIYGNFGVTRWNHWQQSLSSWQNPSVRSMIADAPVNLLTTLSAVISWNDYADYWYRQTGQPLFDLPTLAAGSNINQQKIADTTSYDVFYTLDEAEGELKLRFASTGKPYSTLVSVEAQEVYSKGVESTTVTFTGAQDSVVLKVDPLINTLRLTTPEHPELRLNSMKPASFLIYDFRNGETVSARAAAARKLGEHTENSDLQLAIRDFMDQDLDPKVRAALLSSLANLTKGAEGTQQVFLEALNSKQMVLRKAGLKGLKHFSSKAEISDQVQSIAKNTDDFDFFKYAVQTSKSLMSGDEYKSFVASITKQDTTGRKSIFMLGQLAEMGKGEQAVEEAEQFINDRYAYQIRKQAMKLLIEQDQSAEAWMARAEKLLADADPRIRFLAVQALQKHSGEKVQTFLAERIQDEYDARVHKKMQQILQ